MLCSIVPHDLLDSVFFILRRVRLGSHLTQMGVVLFKMTPKVCVFHSAMSTIGKAPHSNEGGAFQNVHLRSVFFILRRAHMRSHLTHMSDTAVPSYTAVI